MEKDLEDIKVGDEVILVRSILEKKVVVKSVTKDIITISCGFEFYRKNGCMVGVTSSPIIYIINPEVLSPSEERRFLIEKLSGFPFDTLPTDVLEKAYKLINK